VTPNHGNGKDHVLQIKFGADDDSLCSKGQLKENVKELLEQRKEEFHSGDENDVLLVRIVKC
jgi:hypothetical protein